LGTCRPDGAACVEPDVDFGVLRCDDDAEADDDSVVGESLGELLGVLVLPGGGHSGLSCLRSRATIASASPLLFAVIPDST
jgi:hypothetical protein